MYLYTTFARVSEVGYYGPDNRWNVESKHDSREGAARRVSYLNGNPTAEHAKHPDGAAAMYLTAASQPVYAFPGGPGANYPRFECRGCGRMGTAVGNATLDADAEDHAAACRRVPIPGAPAWPKRTSPTRAEPEEESCR